jgi:hypothetical protein
MIFSGNIVTSSQIKISSSELSVSDEQMRAYVIDYVPRIHQNPDRFEFGDYSGKKAPKAKWALINGRLFEIAQKQEQQEGFNSNMGLFKVR